MKEIDDDVSIYPLKLLHFASVFPAHAGMIPHLSRHY